MDGILRRRAMMKKPAASGDLPSEYQRVEYITSSGSQYIDLGISLTRSSVITCTAMLNANPAANVYLFGGRTSATSNNLQFYRNQASQFTLDYGSYADNRIQIAQIYNAWFTVQIGNSKMLIDSTEYSLSSTADFSTPYTYLFDAYNKHSGQKWTGRVARFAVEGVMDLIPCYRKSDSVIGMYDLISGTFFTNDGTGSFTKGADVE